MGVASWWAIYTPLAALVAPGARVTNATPGCPVSLPVASAIIAAPPSWRQTMVRMEEVSKSASSAAMKLSPGTVNSVWQPSPTSWSIRILPPVRITDASLNLAVFRNSWAVLGRRGRRGIPLTRGSVTIVACRATALRTLPDRLPPGARAQRRANAAGRPATSRAPASRLPCHKKALYRGVCGP